MGSIIGLSAVCCVLFVVSTEQQRPNELLVSLADYGGCHHAELLEIFSYRAGIQSEWRVGVLAQIPSQRSRTTGRTTGRKTRTSSCSTTRALWMLPSNLTLLPLLPPVPSSRHAAPSSLCPAVHRILSCAHAAVRGRASNEQMANIIAHYHSQLVNPTPACTTAVPSCFPQYYGGYSAVSDAGDAWAARKKVLNR